MNRLFEKAGRMLRDNRRRRRLLGLATVAGAVVAVVCTALLMYPAHALTGGDALRSAIDDDSAVFWRPAGAGDAAWAKTDGGSALDVLMVVKYLDRIGDHAVNIAHWVIYSITGELESE